MKRHKKENLSLSLDAETRLLAEHAAAVQGSDAKLIEAAKLLDQEGF